jgi:lipoyl(octanoyl) transferase
VNTFCASLRAVPDSLRVRRLPGLSDYETTWRAMQEFTRHRGPETPDEIWLLQHPPVYTLGLAGKPEHLLRPSAIPLVKVDRGGQITYHGPGQIVVYLLVDLRRRALGIRPMVSLMEDALIALLAHYGISAERQPGAPGVYVAGAKIAALGLRVQRGCCYHGLAFNVDMDLAPFGNINPCGYAGMPVTQARDLGIRASIHDLESRLLQELASKLDSHPPRTS